MYNSLHAALAVLWSCGDQTLVQKLASNEVPFQFEAFASAQVRGRWLGRMAGQVAFLSLQALNKWVENNLQTVGGAESLRVAALMVCRRAICKKVARKKVACS